MSLHDDLLEQADHLVRRDPTRPKQASLRRAVSTAYYALFHLLVREATAILVSDSKLRQLVPRAFDHGEMKRACEQFVRQFPEHLKKVASSEVPDDLKFVAEAFIQLQQARHEADYAASGHWNRSATIDHLRRVRDSFAAWQRVRGQHIALVFLVNLLLGTKWKR